MAINPIAFTEKVVKDFLRYQLSAYPFADPGLHAQMRRLLNLAETRRSPLFQGPFISLAQAFRTGASVADMIREGVFHPGMKQLIDFPNLYGHQEKAIRAIAEGLTALISTGTGSGKTECFLYPIISRCLQLRDEKATAGIVSVIVYPMNALAEDQLLRLRGLLAGTGVTFGMYVGKTPENSGDVAGIRLRPGTSRQDYQKALERERGNKDGQTVYPGEEICSREEMRTPGTQPRILLTNVKQLELLLTRQKDVELFDKALLEFLVFDEAHTFSGALGAETACLIRRLRAFCGKEPENTVCVATSATIADPEQGEAVGKRFASRFFGVPEDRVALVGEEYVEETWSKRPRKTAAPTDDSRKHLEEILAAVDADEGAPVLLWTAYSRMTGRPAPAAPDLEALFAELASADVAVAIAALLKRPRPLEELVEKVGARFGREVKEEELLAWLALGAAARMDGRPLFRPVVHGFIRGIDGGVVTFADDSTEPKLWLSTEDQAAKETERRRLPVLTCNTCGQHYFVHHAEEFTFAGRELGGGRQEGDARVWPALDEAQGGKRLVMTNRLITHDEEDEDPEKTAAVHFCRFCGALHDKGQDRCLSCSRLGPMVRLMVCPSKEDYEGYLTRCLSCAATGRPRGSRYREPARPVRAVNVSDVHVLAQDMIHHSERRRLLVFADSRQDAAFQAGWMRDHARRFRMRSMMMERIQQKPVSVGDLTHWLDEKMRADDELSRALCPEVWEHFRKEAAGQAHAQQRALFLRLQILRELMTSPKQRVGLEPWGRMTVQYLGLTPDHAFVKAKAAELGVDAVSLCDGIASILDNHRRSMAVLDRETHLFSKFWSRDEEVKERGYVPEMPGVPKAIKFHREDADKRERISHWMGKSNTTVRQLLRKWGVEAANVEPLAVDLWRFLKDDLKLIVEVTLRGSGGKAVPGTAGGCQVDVDRLLLAPHLGVYRCNTCRRHGVRNAPHRSCPAWQCNGTLEFVADDPDNYDLALLDGGFEMLRPREHSAQVPHDERERIENQFKGSTQRVNTLVCTPTLEMGVDIGDLDSTLLRNVPPLPSNYWQRVGRAGRRHRMAVSLTYARGTSHDRQYFRQPLKLLEGQIEPPSFNLRNDQMVRKHVHACVITRLRRLQHAISGLADEARNEIAEVLDAVLPSTVTSYLFDEGLNIRPTPLGVSKLGVLIDKHIDDLRAHAMAVFTQVWPEDDQSVVAQAVIEEAIRAMAAELQQVVSRLKQRLDWHLAQMSRVETSRQPGGERSPEDRALYERCERYVKRIKGVEARRRSEAEGYDDLITYGVLATEGFLPGYGLDAGSVLGTTQGGRAVSTPELRLPRPPAVALREYIPGNLIYANGHRYVARRFHHHPEETPVFFQVDVAQQAVAEVKRGLGAVGLDAEGLRAIAMCDVDLLHQSYISDEEENRFRLAPAIYGYDRGRHNGGTAYRWGDRVLQHRHNASYRLVNVGADTLVKSGRGRGFPVCLVCGDSRSPFSSQVELDNFRTRHSEICGVAPDPIGLYADVTVDSFTLPDLKDREEAYSVIEALRAGAASLLEMEREDLETLMVPKVGEEGVLGVLYDPMPGGSGLLDQMISNFSAVVEQALEATRCPAACERSCPDCLQTFRNAFYHQHLNRHVAAEKFAQWGSALEKANEIPPRLDETTDSRTEAGPINKAEDRLKSMLQKAGFPEPQWKLRIKLAGPPGSTTPDCYWPAPNSETGLCLYLDGLSVGIHGNPEAQRRDREIQELLESMGYDVVRIPASELNHLKSMTRHLQRVAQKLRDPGRALNLAEDPNWFAE